MGAQRTCLRTRPLLIGPPISPPRCGLPPLSPAARLPAAGVARLPARGGPFPVLAGRAAGGRRVRGLHHAGAVRQLAEQVCAVGKGCGASRIVSDTGGGCADQATGAEECQVGRVPC